jgi:hypothetical protein
MDTKLMGLTKSVMKDGEKKAPVKKISLKVKFQDAKKEALEKKKKGGKE